jgi:hypothetical protein
MAVLEAFVYDPLLNWRLIDNKPKERCQKCPLMKQTQEKILFYSNFLRICVLFREKIKIKTELCKLQKDYFMFILLRNSTFFYLKIKGVFLSNITF